MIYRREALHLWKQKLGSRATYTNLIGVFERAGRKDYADLVRQMTLDSDLTMNYSLLGKVS